MGGPPGGNSGFAALASMGPAGAPGAARPNPATPAMGMPSMGAGAVGQFGKAQAPPPMGSMAAMGMGSPPSFDAKAPAPVGAMNMAAPSFAAPTMASSSAKKTTSPEKGASAQQTAQQSLDSLMSNCV